MPVFFHWAFILISCVTVNAEIYVNNFFIKNLLILIVFCDSKASSKTQEMVWAQLNEREKYYPDDKIEFLFKTREVEVCQSSGSIKCH